MTTTVFSGKRVLLTGHTGFKGAWLSLLLHRLGARAHGFSLPPNTHPSLYHLARIRETLAGETIGDIRDRELMRRTLDDVRPDVIIHMAAQALVRESYAAPFDTFDVNVMGTASLLDALRGLRQPCAVVCVTSDKCYENREQVWGYRECDAMGGFDPYSASKGAAEILIASYRRSFFPPDRLGDRGVQIASARAGNVIGGGDWSRDRIVTDLVAALLEGRPAAIRNPGAIRPWQHVLEPLSGYLSLAAAMIERPGPRWSSAWNFGPGSGSECAVGQLADAFIQAWGSGAWEDHSKPDHPHEASVLRLSIEKASWELGWRPRWDRTEMIARTARWYRGVLGQGADAQEACENDIEAYGAIL